MLMERAVGSGADGVRWWTRRSVENPSTAQSKWLLNWARVSADRWLFLVDAVIVTLAYALALLFRFGLAVPGSYWSRFPGFLLLALVVYLGLHAGMALYGAVWLQAGPLEAWKLVVASTAATSVLLLAAAIPTVRPTPMSVPLVAGALALLLFGAARFGARVLAARPGAATAAQGARVILVGPVAAARAVVQQMRAETEAGYLPVAVVTDEAQAWRRELSGVPVVGPLDDLGVVAARYRAEQVLFVFGSSGRDQMARVLHLVKDVGLLAKTLPTIHETMGRQARLRDIRDLSVADLLGRDQVQIDVAAVGRIITGRRVLITGAGGSIGSEIAAQVSRFEPSLLVLLDHDETHLHDALSRVQGPARPVLGDLREEPFINALFAETMPDVVFHAAAHKHVPVLEAFPSEAVRTNVVGTEILVRAAVRHGTARFVAISTDKAVSPSGVMGASKRLAEQVVHHLRPEGRRFCCVRFGNVLGSRGSVVPTFVRQVQEGGPVTVTHPDMTRFFMTTGEAVQLVLQAAATAEGGEVFMLDMGEPVRIVELAERIIALADLGPGREIEIVFTGLRPGERLTEKLHSDVEAVLPTAHPKIHLVEGPAPPAELLFAGIAELADRAAVRDEVATRTLLLELAQIPEVLCMDGESVLTARQRQRLQAAPAGSAVR
ncbi:MAG: Polysaccharide biosynthesis protein CapD-like [Frankiales bacterium]|nr:Polysaccharide biosynthesis protein CapD-like [Frankiales bacterium]